MGQILVVVLAFGGLLYWVVGASLRDRNAYLRRYPSIYFSIIALELIGFGFVLALAPALRTRVGLLIALPAAFTIHLMATRYAADALEKQDMIDPKPRRPKNKTGKAEIRESEISGRAINIYFYVGLIALYLVVLALILVINHITAD